MLAAPSGIRVSPAQAHSLALIINELAANVHKHVLAQRASVCIDVSFSLDGDSILMVFRDDGPGFPASIVSRDVNGGGTGFEIIGNLARRSLKGTIRLSNEPGATVRLRFPIDATMDNTNRIAREGGYS
ncbi:MAG: Histidine kinase-, DNA gyrase B-, and HSP90-like ATPase [candidate division BRC1 bacterium ADurb.BinA364]|nr:MAG: Histidine kinase-, DNA gyrase B-, and HSP90-like ATPase [candidate division BRC1 bacterium ADurb.BinA364]